MVLLGKQGEGREPDAVAFGRWAGRMTEGKFEEAWRLGDRQGRHWPSAHRLWDERGLWGRDVVVRSLHGLGDAVQMLRYARRLREVARSVRYEVPGALLPLLPYFDGAGDAGGNGATEGLPVGPEVAIEMTELPYVFRTRMRQLPLRTRYLTLPEELVRQRGSSMGVAGKRRVGVVWAGGEWDRERWVELERLRPLLEDGRFEWWNLQGGAASKEAAGWGMQELPRQGGVLELAATMANLDLVVTVDTLAAHLAGALGVRTWVMLKQDADWRWMAGREDSPWYPSMRLFRQRRAGDWGWVVEAMRGALDKGWRRRILRVGADGRTGKGDGNRNDEIRGVPSTTLRADPSTAHRRDETATMLCSG